MPKNITLKVTNRILSPAKSYAKSVAKIEKVMHKIHKDANAIKSVLRKKIHLKFAGIIVKSFSAQQVLNDWKRAVKEVEKVTHIADAEKWLKNEVRKILKPEVNAIKKTIKRMIKRVKIHGMNINDIKVNFAKLDKKFKSININHNLGGELKRFENTFKAIKKQCH